MDDMSHADTITTLQATVAKDAAVDTRRQTLRKRLFAGLAGGVAIIAVAYSAYSIVVASHHATTDDAYVGAETADITPLVNGPVQQVPAWNTEEVKRGQVLVKLDDTDTRLALSRAEASLTDARSQVLARMAKDVSLKAEIAARAADIDAAQANLSKTQTDLARRRALVGAGGVSADEVTAAQNAYNTAKANLDLANANHEAAIAAYDANHAMIDGPTVDTNSTVLAALAARDQAQVNLDRTVIRAPVDGVVTSRDVQVGQQVQTGQQLMLVVPVQQAYVDANFKEGQLAKVRPGQEVTLTSDLYGGDVTFHGRVAGFSGGTGAAFAVLPAQNATGNWIKVVQRLPVRINLDPKELAAHPLRVGLSMNVDVDIAKSGD